MEWTCDKAKPLQDCMLSAKCRMAYIGWRLEPPGSCATAWKAEFTAGKTALPAPLQVFRISRAAWIYPHFPCPRLFGCFAG